MRQGRTVFAAVVIHQHPDDGSLDLIIWYEAEDQIWEQRVRQRSETQPCHCWDFVPPLAPGDHPDDHLGEDFDAVHDRIDELEGHMGVAKDLARALMLQMYGDYEAPSKPMIEYLDDFDVRLKKLEKQLRK